MTPTIFVVSLLVSLIVCSCGGPPSATEAAAPSAAGYPVTLANCGSKVTVKAAPQRAISINQPATELLLTLGLADKMVGSASWNDSVAPELAAENAKVPVLSQNFPSFERVLKERPDFVYATFDYSFTDEGVAPRDRFERLGVATYQSSSECGGQDAAQQRALTLDDMYAEIGDVAKIFGVPERGDKLVTSLRSRRTTATDGLNAGDVSLMWWYAGTKTPYIAGCCGAPGIITAAVGARNAFADNRQLWPEISWEAILQRDPDVLVLADLTRGDDGDSVAAKLKFLETDPAASKLKAVRERRWIILPGTAMDPSLRNVDAVETVAAGLRSFGLGGK
ncbi:ABC transporter substrate-binding protein [Mycobacterium sp. CBMA293]|uniref:ABC transporter substrate-binding protein n=1 Tax=unclassified Mycolicibacterium TaxID=2636767 RepID=UPI0012DBFE38|nr:MULTISPECIES: ABC transporter substrate-binding protein [unclassified Mycolicibacterium]MUL47806.1 ABC transporter substrate-binding protein [Mycolicibacterium sp. CBMA 360]MUL59347.1 ABC transporter substrate-binding protein [Mycolicibacterium sp. CBMA 335]MUL71072.1 ABC transporter substrate-binding protein [Mycolicibacterium sp. CBMA 311]MUL94715.1 ABC transporter substrate-binding protein [Mycolicibacterium sp. CBMA 230]MUM09107.1 ABC transporter substrate-binding protein [Mycolicibacte